MAVAGGGKKPPGSSLPALGPQAERLAEVLGAPQGLNAEGLPRQGLELRPSAAMALYETQVMQAVYPDTCGCDNLRCLTGHPACPVPPLVEIEELRQEKGFLEDQLQRALKELKAYQLQYPSARAQVSREAEEMADLPSWNLSQVAMTPLVAAYDRRLEELEAIKDSQASKMESMTERLEALVAENEDLRRGQIDRLEASLRDGPGVPNTAYAHAERGAETRLLSGEAELTERLSEMKERLDLLTAENTVLVEQADMTTRELRKANQELDEKDKQLQTLLQSLNEAGQTVQALEEEVAELRDNKAQCEAQLLQRTSELSRTAATLTEHKAALETSQAQVSTLSGKLEESRETITALSSRLEQETDALTSKYQACGKRIRDLQTQLVAKSEELDVTDEKLRKALRDVDTMRIDAEGMLKVMSGMQKQLDEYAAREQEIERMTKEIREQNEEVLLEREQAKAREVQTRRELARLLEARRVDAEKRVEETQTLVIAAKAKLQEQYEKREEELKEALAEAARMRVELDKALRERRSSDALYTALAKEVKDEQATLKQRFNELQQRVVEAEVERENADSKAQQASKELARIRLELASKDEKWAGVRKQLEDHIKVRERELSSIREIHRRSELDSENRAREISRLQKRLEEAEVAWEGRVEALKQAQREEIEALNLKVLKAEAVIREQEPMIADFQDRQARLMEKVKTDTKAATEHLERTLRDEREMLQRVTLRNQELSQRLAAASSEKAELLVELEASREDVQRFEEALQHNARKVGELTAQLSDSLGAQQALAKDEARLRAELSRAQIQLAQRTRD